MFSEERSGKINKIIEEHSVERYRGKTLQGKDDIRYCIQSEDYENFEIDLKDAITEMLKNVDK